MLKHILTISAFYLPRIDNGFIPFSLHSFDSHFTCWWTLSMPRRLTTCAASSQMTTRLHSCKKEIVTIHFRTIITSSPDERVWVFLISDWMLPSIKFGPCEDHAAASSMWHPWNNPDLSGRFPFEVEYQQPHQLQNTAVIWTGLWL